MKNVLAARWWWSTGYVKSDLAILAQWRYRHPTHPVYYYFQNNPINLALNKTIVESNDFFGRFVFKLLNLFYSYSFPIREVLLIIPTQVFPLPINDHRKMFQLNLFIIRLSLHHQKIIFYLFNFLNRRLNYSMSRLQR